MPADKRMSPRLEMNLPVLFKARDRDIPARTLSIARHGAFIETTHLRPVGELVQMAVALPSDMCNDPEPIRITGVVARSISITESRRNGTYPGIGIKFFMISALAKRRWDDYFQRELNQAEGKDPAKAFAEAARKPLGCPSDFMDEPVRFLVRPQSMERIRQLFAYELRTGRFFLRTPLLRGVGEDVMLLVIHPISEEEFSIPGRVEAQRAGGPVTQRGMEILLLDWDSRAANSFAQFVLSGDDEMVDLRMAQ